ncbi:MAG: thioredoxin-dependent thiol peroxidase [Luteitalea sp.]|nr:thioredoxin-dependent thiol peroxidase [Luteitalea sp.]
MPFVEPGRKAPAFSLKDQHGETHRLTDYAGHSLVLYFYPKDDTPGCTKEACSFEASLAQLRKLDAVVLGVSVLDSASKARFAAKHNLTFPLLADEDHAVAEKYGAWQERSMYGRKFMGVARVSYLIDAQGKVAKRWDKVDVNQHVTDVLQAIQALP